MIERKPHTIWKSAAVVIILAVLLPSVLSFIHSTQGHEHLDDCELVSDVHLHENEVDCELDGITLNKVAVYAFAKAYTLKKNIIAQEEIIYKVSFIEQSNISTDSRGPPVV